MFHLLSETDKSGLLAEYRRRRLLVGLALLLVLIVASALLLLPSYMLTQSKESTAQAKVLSFTGGAASVDASTTIALGDDQNLIAALSPESDRSFAEILERLQADAGSGITLTAFFWTNDSGSPFDLTINGTATDRETLVAFGAKLQNESGFTTVDLPVSDLAKDKDIDFSIHITGT